LSPESEMGKSPCTRAAGKDCGPKGLPSTSSQHMLRHCRERAIVSLPAADAPAADAPRADVPRALEGGPAGGGGPGVPPEESRGLATDSLGLEEERAARHRAEQKAAQAQAQCRLLVMQLHAKIKQAGHGGRPYGSFGTCMHAGACACGRVGVGVWVWV